MRKFPRPISDRQRYLNRVRKARFAYLQLLMSTSSIAGAGVVANRLLKIIQEPYKVTDLYIILIGAAFATIATALLWWYILPNKEKHSCSE